MDKPIQNVSDESLLKSLNYISSHLRSITLQIDETLEVFNEKVEAFESAHERQVEALEQIARSADFFCEIISKEQNGQ